MNDENEGRLGPSAASRPYILAVVLVSDESIACIEDES